MSISSIGSSSYSAYTYQWQNSKLQGATENTSISSASNQLSYSGASTVSSMVDLVSYAMEAMGVGSNDRVTFSQVETYKQELEQSFSDSLSAKIAATGVASDAFFSVTLDEAGKMFVNTSHTDGTKIQAYFDANPSIGTDLLKQIQASGLEVDGSVKFNVSSTGTISLNSTSTTSADLQNAFKDNTILGTEFLEKLKLEDIELEGNIELHYANGELSVKGDSEQNEALQNYLNVNPELLDEVKAVLDENELSDLSDVTLTIDNNGNITTTTPLDSEETKMQNFLIEHAIGYDLKSELKNQGIDPSIDFRLTVADGKVVVNSSHPDAAKVQALIDSDEELAKNYLQIDALAGIDSARKSMQVSSSDMRTLIEMQSMSNWWSESGGSSIGSYFDGSLSTMTGVNSIV